MEWRSSKYARMSHLVVRTTKVWRPVAVESIAGSWTTSHFRLRNSYLNRFLAKEFVPSHKTTHSFGLNATRRLSSDCGRTTVKLSAYAGHPDRCRRSDICKAQVMSAAFLSVQCALQLRRQALEPAYLSACSCLKSDASNVLNAVAGNRRRWRRLLFLSHDVYSFLCHKVNRWKEYAVV